jgi:hypothetical protein
MVSTQDFESCDPSSNLGGTCSFAYNELMANIFRFYKFFYNFKPSLVNHTINTIAALLTIFFSLCQNFEIRPREARSQLLNFIFENLS